MLLSSTPKKEKRESAPPAARSWIASKFTSGDSGSTNDRPKQQPQPQQQQRRASSHTLIPAYSPNSLRPLPALPLSRASPSLSSEDSIKVPVDDDAVQQPPLLSSISTANRLHPSIYSPRPLSPQLRAINPGGGTSTDGRRSSLEHQSSMSSNNSSNNSHHGSLASLRHQHQRQVQQQQHQHQHLQLQQPSLSDLHRVDHAAPSRQTQEQGKLGYGEDYGPSYGYQSGRSTPPTVPLTVTAVEPELGIEPGRTAHREGPRRNSNQFSPNGTKTPSEDSLHHHFSNLLNDNPRQNVSSSPSPSSAQSVSVIPGTAASLLDVDFPQSPFTPSSGPLSLSLPLSPTISLSFASCRVQNEGTETGSLPSSTLAPVIRSDAQFIVDPKDLQPYYPPPPPSSIGSKRPQFHSQESIATSAGTVTSIPTMTTGATSTLIPARSRRHSSSAGTLMVQTQHIHSIRKGPNTADSSVPITSRLPDRRPHLKNSVSGPKQLTSQLPPRQSPNRLVIPQKSLTSRPVGTQSPSLYESTSPTSLQQRHYSTLQAETPSGSNDGKQHYNSRPQYFLNEQQQTQQQQRHQYQPHQQLASRQNNFPRTTSPSSSALLDTFQDRTAMALMQRYLTHPDDPESEVDIAMQILISQAAVDSKGFEVLIPATVENAKRHHTTLSSRIAALTARLSLESKIREAAQSLLKLHADNKKLARQASDHLEAANRKVDQVATELWKLTQLAADLQRTLLQHTSGVLALGVVRLEDQSRREREMYAIQLQQATMGPSQEEQIEAMSRTISSLEADAFEAQALLEDKDRAIGRLMKQLEHQQDLFMKLDEQQHRTMELARIQQRNQTMVTDSGLEASNAKVEELTSVLGLIGKRLQKILQLQQQNHENKKLIEGATSATVQSDGNQRSKSQRDRSAQKWPSETTLLSKTSTLQTQEPPLAAMQENPDSTVSSGLKAQIDTGSRTDSGDSTPNHGVQSCSKHVYGGGNEADVVYISPESIRSILDALEEHASVSQDKMAVLEGELGLLRRQSLVLSQSRANSVKVRSSSKKSVAVEETIRAALEKSLKDALLEKEMAKQELENERQRWQDDQNHRIRALEESLGAVEDQGQLQLSKDRKSHASEPSDNNDIMTLELRRQLREAIDEIDMLSLQQQSSLKSMRQLFDLLPDPRKRSHMQLYSSYQHLQQQIANNSGPKGSAEVSSGRASPAGSISSSTTSGAVGFTMDALIVRVKEMVARLQQLERDNTELRQHLQNPEISRDNLKSSQEYDSDHEGQHYKGTDDPHSTWILKTDLERLQASNGMVQLLEKELELLKQHTDMLLDENARLADLAAATTTGVGHTSVVTFVQGGLPSVEKPSLEDALGELQAVVRAKDKLLQEREEIFKAQEQTLQNMREELSKAIAEPSTPSSRTTTATALNDIASDIQLSDYDLRALEDFRDKCRGLEEQIGEMRMTIAALESMTGGPGSGSQILQHQQQQQQQSYSAASWLSSSLGAVGSLSFGSLSPKNYSTAATAGSTNGTSLVNSSSPSGLSSPSPSYVEAVYGSNSGHSVNTSIGQQNLSLGTHTSVTGATTALRKEFRRVMHELREEKDTTVRKEVEERRRLERVVRQLRRDIQALEK